MEISRMRDLGPKRFRFWGRMLLNLKIGLRIGLPSLALLTLAGCDGGKRFLTLPSDKATSWGSIARDLCPTGLNLSKQIQELNFNEALPANADTRWFSRLYSNVRIAIPEIKCETLPATVSPVSIPVPIPVPNPIPVPPPSVPDARTAEQKDVVESQPDVTPTQPDVQDTAPTKVKPDSGRRPPRHDAHTGGGSDTQTPTPPVIPQ
jgi:hypothetical protein